MRHHPNNPADDLNVCQFQVKLDTTSHCNLRCGHCWMDAVRAQGYTFRNEVMPFELYSKIVADLKGHVAGIALSCGFEPLLNKEFARYVRHARESGMPDLHFTTNGMLMTPALARDLVEAGPDRILFSLDAVTEDNLAAIRTGATLEGVTSAIRMVRDEKTRLGIERPRLEINWVVLPANLDEMARLPALAADCGADLVTLLPHQRWDGSVLAERPFDSAERTHVLSAISHTRTECAARGLKLVDEWFLATVPQESPRPQSGIRAIARRLRDRWTGRTTDAADSVPFCCQPWEVMLVTSQGRIIPCYGALFDNIYGDFRTQTLREIWESAAHRQLREGLKTRPDPNPTCAECPNNRASNKSVAYHEPWGIEPERLRQAVPGITRKQSKSAE